MVMEKQYYRTILIDPPWPEKGAGKIKRGADRHYGVMNSREILRVILNSGVFNPLPDAHLYLWVTNNYLPDALWLIDALGFKYKTTVTWAKDRMGLGRYFRGRTEQLLFATSGNGMLVREMRTQRKDLTTLILAKHAKNGRGKIVHSAKPEESYRLVEAASPSPRLEMFARRKRPGWTAWGDELDG